MSGKRANRLGIYAVPRDTSGMSRPEGPGKPIRKTVLKQLRVGWLQHEACDRERNTTLPAENASCSMYSVRLLIGDDSSAMRKMVERALRLAMLKITQVFEARIVLCSIPARALISFNICRMASTIPSRAVVIARLIVR